MSAISRRRILLLIGAGLAGVELVVTIASTWVYVQSHDRTSEAADAPTASVALVLGAKVIDGEPDRTSVVVWTPHSASIATAGCGRS